MEYTFDQILLALLVTLFAGLSTSVGSAIALFAKSTNTKFLCLSLGFSAGVMIYVSFMEILPKSKVILVREFGNHFGSYLMVAAFFAGIVITAIIDRLIPEFKNPHEHHRVEEMENMPKTSSYANPAKLMRTGIFTALALSLHNFPEGIATFTATLTEPSMGIAIAIAIAIHNIPEGIAVSVPVFHASGSRKKAFWVSTASGLAEPVGALICYALFMPFISANAYFLGIIFGLVAGIMVFISLDELLPAAEEYGEHHLAIYGIVAGMLVMAVSLLLFN
jgi:ZIP family zinc transporter